MPKINRLLTAVFLSLGLLLAVTGWAAGQEPPLKGTEPTPALPASAAATPTPAAVPPIDPALLRKIEPQLLKRLLEADGEPVPFIAYLQTQVEVDSAGVQAESDPLARRQTLVDTLQQTAQQSQAGVLR